MEQVTFEKIKDLLAQYGRKGNLTKNTIFQSLGFLSEDIDDFFEKYSRLFNIDMHRFNYNNFFFEDVHPIIKLRDSFYRIFTPEKVRKKNFTLGHLVQVAEQGKWFDPD